MDESTNTEKYTINSDSIKKLADADRAMGFHSGPVTFGEIITDITNIKTDNEEGF